MKTPSLTDFQLMVLEKNEIDCLDVVELLGDLADGDLPPTLRARVEDHIAGCDFCADMRAGYDLTIELARELKDEDQPLPTGVQNRLRSALNAKLGLNLTPVR